MSIVLFNIILLYFEAPTKPKFSLEDKPDPNNEIRILLTVKLNEVSICLSICSVDYKRLSSLKTQHKRKKTQHFINILGGI